MIRPRRDTSQAGEASPQLVGGPGLGSASSSGWTTSESSPGVPPLDPAIGLSATSGQARETEKESDDLSPEGSGPGNPTRTDRGPTRACAADGCIPAVINHGRGRTEWNRPHCCDVAPTICG